jgi:hypothetical protein
MRVSRASSTTPSSCATRTIRALQLCRKVGLPVPERRGSGRDLYTRRAGAAVQAIQRGTEVSPIAAGWMSALGRLKDTPQ